VLRSDAGFSTLRRERELVESYLDIERERFEERLQIEIDIPREMDDVVLPSLIVQPLVENAIKHGITPARDGGRVTVSVFREDSSADVVIQIRNTGAVFQGRLPAADGGVGLANVERRLETHYGARSSLRVTATLEGETLAELRLPNVDAEGVAAATAEGRRRAG
jgi:LytS/YehU family sensor histidine kinase